MLLAALVAVGVCPFAAGGCSSETRYRVLSTVFDGVPPPGTPRPERRKRRTARVEPPPAPGEGIEGLTLEDLAASRQPPPPGFDTYEEALAALPKDSMGNLDWMAAARAGLIEPRPGPEPEAQAFPELPYNVVLDPGIPGFEVVFPHGAHTYWLRCDSCHPSIFRMKAGSNPITMGKILEGEYCGRCHGKVAFPPETACSRCHTKLGQPAG